VDGEESRPAERRTVGRIVHGLPSAAGTATASPAAPGPRRPRTRPSSSSRTDVPVVSRRPADRRRRGAHRRADVTGWRQWPRPAAGTPHVPVRL